MPQSVQEFVPQTDQDYAPPLEQEILGEQGYDEYYDQMDNYMNNMNLTEQPMTNAQRLDAYFYNRQQQPFPRQVVCIFLLNLFA